MSQFGNDCSKFFRQCLISWSLLCFRLQNILIQSVLSNIICFYFNVNTPGKINNDLSNVQWTHKLLVPVLRIYFFRAAPWRTCLRRSLLTTGVPSSRLGHSMSFRGGRNVVWVGFSRGFSRFLLPQISFHHFSALIHFVSFNIISSTPLMVR